MWIVGNMITTSNGYTYPDPFWDRAIWYLKFVIWPRRCAQSGKRIWLEYAYRGDAVWYGPGDPVFATKWHKKAEHMVWLLKKG